MATSRNTVEFICGQIRTAGQVTSRKMFGEYAIYCDGKRVALVCDDRLFIKPTDAGHAYLGEVTAASPYPGAKPCFLIAGDVWDDADWLSRLFRISAAALPTPRVKTSKPRVAKKRDR